MKGPFIAILSGAFAIGATLAFLGVQPPIPIGSAATAPPSSAGITAPPLVASGTFPPELLIASAAVATFLAPTPTPIPTPVRPTSTPIPRPLTCPDTPESLPQGTVCLGKAPLLTPTPMPRCETPPVVGVTCVVKHGIATGSAR